MLVPRSYQYQPPSPPQSKSPREKDSSPLANARFRPAPPRLQRIPERFESQKPEMPGRTISEPVTVPTKPVVIPSRSRSGLPTATQTMKARGPNGSRRSSTASSAHKPDAVPPAVAALLAITAIPPPKDASRRRKSAQTTRHISIDELVREWKEESLGSSFKGTHMDILLEQPDEIEIDMSSVGDLDEKDHSALASRSVSSESIPSLTDDARSILSFSSPCTPPNSNSRKPSVATKEKVVSSPPIQDCLEDHPLLEPYIDEDSTSVPPVELLTPAPSPSPTPRLKMFKSNLTSALKSGFKSFSNFAVPLTSSSVPPDDFLTRSILYPRFTSEMRPNPHQGPGVADPALRRYLNPDTGTVRELSYQVQEMFLQHSSLDVEETPMIKLQTYRKNGKGVNPSQRRTSSASEQKARPLTEAGRAANVAEGSLRQREPRENSDFLRVIVLEMNMRRVGKLDPKAMGKARIWLPPRKSSAQRSCDDRVPSRWLGVSYDDYE